MATCVRCGNEAGFVGSLNFNKVTGRCGKCENEVKQALQRFRVAFLNYTQDGVISPYEWASLQAGAQSDRLNMFEALAFVRGDALNLLDRTIAFASADGFISDEEEQYIHQLKQFLAIPDNLAQPLLDRLSYLKYISNIRRGVLPTVRSTAHLESDEICHHETPATYHKVNAKSVSLVPGRLVATNKKLVFLSQSGGAEIPWKNIMRIELQGSGVYLELSTKKGNGRYDVPDPTLTEATLDTLVRISKRQLLVPQSTSDSRRIPQDVKLAVWQRDQGKCVQCGATTYLEFDHIIPHSKGGASTVNNIQLLCRRCNLQKSDRI